MVLGFRSLLGTLGRLGGRIGGKLGSRFGSNLKYSRLGASRNSLLRPSSGLVSKKFSKFNFGNVRTRAKNLGSRFLRKGRQGLKGAWRKIEVDPLGTATSAYAATRNPQVTLTIDGLENEGEIKNREQFRNYASFSSW